MRAQSSADPYKRHKTRHRGVTYRIRADGSRAYSVWAGGRFVSVDGGEKEAVAKQAELRGRVSRGEKVAPTNVRFGTMAEEWLASKRKLRTRSRENYRQALDLYLLPRFKDFKLAQVTPDRVAALVRELEADGRSGATIQNVLKPLNGTFKLAARRGMTTQNPVALLTGDERPTVRRKEFRELGPEEVERLLDLASRFEYGPLIRTAIYTGLRKGELLGLQWQDVDFERSVIRVRRQWSQEGAFTDPKTEDSKRDVILAPALVGLLRERREAAFTRGHAKPEDLVFPSRNGTPLGHRNVSRLFTKVVQRAGLAGDDKPTLTFHGLRAVYAAMMIERGITATVLSKQLGHRNATVTEQRYIHLFNRLRTDETVREAIEQAMGLGKSLVSTGGNERESGASGVGANVAPLRAIAPAASA